MKLINQLSKETGVPTGTIRFYEKSGLFAGVKKADITTNNYTYYDDEVVEKLSFINDAKSVGFTLAEIKQVIDAWYTNALSKKQKKQLLQSKIDHTDLKIKELKNVRKQLLECLAEIEGSK